MKPVRLLWGAIAVAVVWSGWWVWGAWSAKSGLETWLEARRAAGWQAEWSDISVRGYPTRIDRTITGLTLADTAGGWVWNAPFFQILGLNYQKDHVILVWPDTQMLQTPEERITIIGEELQGSVVFAPGGDHALDRTTLVFKGLTARSDAGWTSAADEIRLATRRVDGSDVTHDVGLDVVGLRPRSEALTRLADAGIVAPRVDRLAADLQVTFDTAWDRQAIETRRPQPREVEIRDLALTWGRLDLRIAGAVTVDPAGRLDGEVMVKATNWKEMLELIRESGTLGQTVAGGLESALEMMSGLAGRSDTLDIPLNFENGRIRIGVLPIAPAPVLRIP